MTTRASKSFYLLSFLPALAYWYLETYHSLGVALLGGVILGVFEMTLEKIFTRHVHTLSKLNVCLIVVLGGISYVAQEGFFFKLQPTLTGLSLSSFLVFKRIRNESLMIDMLNDMKVAAPLPPDIYKTIELHLTYFLLTFSFFMIWVSLYSSTGTWVFWKTMGFYIAFALFTLFDFIYLRKLIRRRRE